MVASHETGNLTRSLVRVPGSGKDKSLEPACIDLSNVSTMAASVPIPRTLPAALKRSLMRNQESDNGAEKKNEMSNVASEKRNENQEKKIVQSQEEEEQNAKQQPLKRPRIVYMTQERARQTFPKGRFVPTSSGTVFLVSDEQMQPQHQHPESVDLTPSQLLQEREILREENRALQHQMVLFQQLFKNKERLTSVVKRLGVQIPEA